jgi:hypothetical protein
MIGILEGSFRMPPSGFVIAFFMVFGGRAMGVRRQLVLLGGFPVGVVHDVSSWETFSTPIACARGGPIAGGSQGLAWQGLAQELIGPTVTVAGQLTK